MVGASRALVGSRPGVRTLLEVPLAALLGVRVQQKLGEHDLGAAAGARALQRN